MTGGGSAGIKAWPLDFSVTQRYEWLLTFWSGDQLIPTCNGPWCTHTGSTHRHTQVAMQGFFGDWKFKTLSTFQHFILHPMLLAK